MKRIGLALFMALVILSSGCICCGNFGGGGNTTSTKEDTTEPTCNTPYIQVGSECCLDSNDNSICDSEENTEARIAEEQQETGTTEPAEFEQGTTTTPAQPTTTMPPVATTQPPTTTISNQPTCSDGIQNQGEEYVDCAGPCTSECVVTTLGGWQEFFGYKFRLKKADITEGGEAKYTVNIRTPDGKEDERLVTTGESFVDSLRFKVINYGAQNPKIYIRVNKADLQKVQAISPDAVMFTIGGKSCEAGVLFATTTEGYLCTRRYDRYNITGSRSENGVTLVIQRDDSPFTKQDLKAGQTIEFKDILIGAIIDREHYIVGGYTLIYVYPK